MVLKPSDRFLSELFYPNLTNYYDQRNVRRFVAEGHSRLSAPLLDIALALIALAGLITGDFSRRGYGVRMGVSAVIALVVRLLALAIQSAARESPHLNALQYILPVLVVLICMWVMIAPLRRRRRARRPPSYAHEDAMAAA
jgi:lipopolysaccharide export system permease protein